MSILRGVEYKGKIIKFLDGNVHANDLMRTIGYSHIREYKPYVYLSEFDVMAIAVELAYKRKKQASRKTLEFLQVFRSVSLAS